MMCKLFFNSHSMFKLLIVLLSISSTNAIANSHLTFQEVQKPIYARAPASLSFYVDPVSGPALIFKYEDSDTPGDIFFTRLNNGSWIEPQATNILNANNFDFSNAVNLSATSNMLVLRGDDTDYQKVLGLTSPPLPPANETTPILSGISDADLDTLLNDNQRLFYSLSTGGNWTGGQVIPGTNKAQNTILYSAGDNTAIAVYVIDEDDDTSTLNDIDLYYVFYANNAWTAPQRLTNTQLVEYAVKIIDVNGEYFITWLVDEDTNAATAGDNRLYFSAIDSTGVISAPPATVFAQTNANTIYTLGKSGTNAIVLWAETLTNGNRVISETQYNGSAWSAVQSSVVASSVFSKAKIFEVNGRLLLVYQQGGVVYLARHNGTQWVLVETITDLIENSISSVEVDFSVINNTLWLAYSGRTEIANDGEDPDVGDGLYIASYKLAYDLAVDFVPANSNSLNVGEAARLSYDVNNKGFADSVEYQLELRQSGVLLTSFSGAALVSGATQNFKYDYIVQNIETPIQATIVADAQDRDNSNNVINNVLTVRPDFYVKGVSKTSATTISVDVRDRKGISSTTSPVVEAYLVQGAVQTLVATSSYDPSSVDEVSLTISQLPTLVAPYKILVKVNQSKNIIEDSYSNNTGVYEQVVETEADYSITNLFVNNTDIKLNITNTGVLNSSAVDLLITDDPLQASQQTTVVAPWYFQTVTLDATGNAALTILRSTLPQVSGQYLYAVINPYNSLAEKDRNNNLIKKLVVPIATPVGSVSLAYQNQNYICENLSFDMVNTGTISAQQVRATLTNSSGIVVASTQLPLLGSGASQMVTFHNVGLDTYTMSLSYLTNNTQQELLNQPVTLSNDACSTTTNLNDINLSAITYLGVNATTGLSEFDIDLRVAGYSVDYRKPLIRLPVNIEIKQGTSLVSSKEIIFYTSPTNILNLERITLAATELPATGGYTLIARVINVADEVQTSNNILTTKVN